MSFFWPTVCLSAGHHLRLTRGPAGNRTTTGSLLNDALPTEPRGHLVVYIMSIQLVLISLIFQVMGFEDEQFGHNVPEALELLNATIHSIIDGGRPSICRSLVTIYHCVGKARAFAAVGIVSNSQSLLSSFQTQPLPSRQWKSLRALNVQLLHRLSHCGFPSGIIR